MPPSRYPIGSKLRDSAQLSTNTSHEPDWRWYITTILALTALMISILGYFQSNRLNSQSLKSAKALNEANLLSERRDKASSVRLATRTLSQNDHMSKQGYYVENRSPGPITDVWLSGYAIRQDGPPRAMEQSLQGEIPPCAQLLVHIDFSTPYEMIGNRTHWNILAVHFRDAQGYLWVRDIGGSPPAVERGAASGSLPPVDKSLIDVELKKPQVVALAPC
jgi:hypothetical protein